MHGNTELIEGECAYDGVKGKDALTKDGLTKDGLGDFQRGSDSAQDQETSEDSFASMAAQTIPCAAPCPVVMLASYLARV